jgi:predicted class III extradiol MEMO1 family dioxygenase
MPFWKKLGHPLEVDKSERWSTPLGTMDAHAPVADGVLGSVSMGHVDHQPRGAMS